MATYGIVAVETIPAFRVRDRPEDYRYVSADPAVKLRIHSPFEFSMGAESWTAELHRAGRVVRRWEDAGDPMTLAPWSADGRRYAFPRFSRRGNGVVAGDAMGRSVGGLSWPMDGYIVTAQWALDVDRLAVLGGGHCLLVDGQLASRAVLPYASGDFGLPSAGWMPGGVVWVLDGRTLGDLRFYDGRDGTLVSEASIDPLDLVPYDHERYRVVPRARYSLDVGPGQGAVGALLDQWSMVAYDRDTGALTLSILRPADRPPNPAVVEELGEGLPVEERWIRVRLGET